MYRAIKHSLVRRLFHFICKICLQFYLLEEIISILCIKFYKNRKML